MKNQRWRNWFLALLLSVFFAYIGSAGFRIFFFRSSQARSEIRQLMTQIQIGDDRKTVRSKFVAGNYQEIRLDDIPEIGKWMLVSTPFEFGAGNWTLYIHLQNEKVSALRLRTNDSMDERPHDPAPADITD